MLINRAIELLHVLALTGAGHSLSENHITEAIWITLAGALCILILALADKIAKQWRGDR